MNLKKNLNKIRERRKNRARAKIFGVSECPRFSVFRSGRYTYGQLIDDEARKTLISASTREFSSSNKKQLSKQSKQNLAEKLGELIAKKAAEKNIKKAVFDRGWRKYHGRVKAVAEGARKEGLQF
ncbi:MAG: 50S ribosomal protein L18 [Patescibacteria group bacterium]